MLVVPPQQVRVNFGVLKEFIGLVGGYIIYDKDKHDYLHVNRRIEKFLKDYNHC